MNIRPTYSQASSYEMNMWDTFYSYSNEQSTSSSEDTALQTREGKIDVQEENPHTIIKTKKKAREYLEKIVQQEKKLGCKYRVEQIHKNLSQRGYKLCRETVRRKIRSLRMAEGLQVNNTRTENSQTQQCVKEYFELRQRDRTYTMKEFHQKLIKENRSPGCISHLRRIIRKQKTVVHTNDTSNSEQLKSIFNNTATQQQEGLDVQIAENPYVTSQALELLEHTNECRDRKLPKKTGPITQKEEEYIQQQIKQEKEGYGRCKSKEIVQTLQKDYSCQATRRTIKDRIRSLKEESGLRIIRKTIIDSEMQRYIEEYIKLRQKKQHIYTIQGFHQHLVRDKNYTGSEEQLRKEIVRIKRQKMAVVHMADTSNSGQLSSPLNNAVFQQQEDRTNVQIAENSYATSQALEHINKSKKRKLPKKTELMPRKVQKHAKNRVKKEKTTGCTSEKFYTQLVSNHSYKGSGSTVAKKTHSLIIDSETQTYIENYFELRQKNQSPCTVQKFHQHLVRKKNYTGTENQLREIISKIENKKRAAVHMADTSNSGQLNSLLNNAATQQQEDRANVQMDEDSDFNLFLLDEEGFDSFIELCVTQQKERVTVHMANTNNNGQLHLPLNNTVFQQQEERTDAQMDENPDSDLLLLKKEEFNSLKKEFNSLIESCMT